MIQLCNKKNNSIFIYFTAVCDSGWQVFRGRCIKIEADSVGATHAEIKCAFLGGYLLRLHTHEEIDELRSNSTLFPSGSGSWILIYIQTFIKIVC